MVRQLRGLESLLASQSNVVARWQMTKPQRRAAALAVRNGEWRKPTHQVFVRTSGPLTTDQQTWVALLHGGPGARLAGRTALTLHGWNEPLRTPFHVVTPPTVRRTDTPDWIRLHRSRATHGPAPSPARSDVHQAAIHAAQWAKTDREAMFIVLSCLQQRLVSPQRLHTLVQHRRRSALITDLADEYRNGITSVNEHDFTELCRKWGLPEPYRQIRVSDAAGRIRAIDATFRLSDGRSKHVEIEGMHHFEPGNFMADIDRHNDLITKGEVYLRVLSYTIKYEPETFKPVLTKWLECEDFAAAG